VPQYTINTISRNPATWARLALRAYLRECKRRARDFRPVMPRMLAVLRENMAEVFENEGAVDGEPRWAQNSRNPIRFHGKMTRRFRIANGRTLVATYFPSYAQWKAYNYPGRKIMELTGKLKVQLTGSSQTGANAPYVRMMRTRLSFGTNYTQYPLGVGRPRSRRDSLRGADQGGVLNDGRENYYPMEPREIFRVTEANLERIEDIALDHITGTVGP
jgi:phage gpG-like protein